MHIDQPEGFEAPRIGDVIRMGLPCFESGSKSPAARDPGQELRSEFEARDEIQPAVLAGEEAYRPEYTRLDLKDIEDYLLGVDAGEREFEYETSTAGYRNLSTGEWREEVPLKDRFARPRPGGPVQNLWEPYVQRSKETKTINTEAQRGLLEMMETDIFPASDRVTAQSFSRQRESDIADVERLGPRATEAMKRANPDQYELLELLNEDAREGMERGAYVDPRTRRAINESVRSAQASRGFGYGKSDLAEEAVANTLYGEDLRDRRRAFAGQVVGYNAHTANDPYQAILNRPGINLTQGNALTGNAQSQRPGPSLYGSNINVNDIFDSNFNASAAANIASANNKAATTGAGIAGGAMIGSALIGL